MATKPASEDILPLNLQQRERVDPHTGCKDILAALDPSWCKDIKFLSYVPPPSPHNDDDDDDDDDDNSTLSLLWLESIELMDSDLHWLLCQPHQRFWCQVIYDSSLHKMLDSYLRYGPRPHEAIPSISQRGREVLASLHRRVFMTFLRMSTHKESANHFLLEDSFGDIIYDHFLFDITRLFDLCSLYHTCNQPLLTKMINNIFTRQPRYQDDLKSVLNSVLNLLDHVTEECVGEGGGERERKKRRAVRLEDVQKRISESMVSSMVVYIADIASSLHHFMDTYPPSISMAVECGLLERLISFYEEIIPPLQEQWLSIKPTLEPQSILEQKYLLRRAKRDIVWLIHTMIRTTFIIDSGVGVAGGVARFLDITSSILSHAGLLREVQRQQFNLSDCVRDVQTLHPTFDQTQFDYIISALGETTSEAAALPSSIGASPIDEEGSVIRVQELLPHLTRPFILCCLREYEYDPETVIHHVLENTLPSHLRSLMSDGDNGDSIKREGVNDDDSGGGLVDQRTSIYDGDEFDIFHRHRDIDMSQIHIGKRLVTTSDTLNDRSHLEVNRERYQLYQYEIESDQEQDDNYYEYDQYQDEYDDTYDSHNVGAADSETVEDLFTVKRLNVKGMFKKQIDTPVEEEEEEEEEREVTPLVPGHVTIMRREHRPNIQRDRAPLIEIVSGENRGKRNEEWRDERRDEGRRDERRRYEDRPNERRKDEGGREGGRGGGRGGRVVRDRQVKEKNKSRVANHSRKAMADRKRGRGM